MLNTANKKSNFGDMKLFLNFLCRQKKTEKLMSFNKTLFKSKFHVQLDTDWISSGTPLCFLYLPLPNA